MAFKGWSTAIGIKGVNANNFALLIAGESKNCTTVAQAHKAFELQFKTAPASTINAVSFGNAPDNASNATAKCVYIQPDGKALLKNSSTYDEL